MNLIIVGAGPAGRTIASVAKQYPGVRVVGYVDDLAAGPIELDDGKSPAIAVLGVMNGLCESAKKHGANTVVIAVGQERSDELLTELVLCQERGIAVYEMHDLYARLTKKICVEHADRGWIVPEITLPANNVYAVFSRCLNVLLGFLGVIFLLLPFFPWIALAIKLDSQGPVLFCQDRAGYKGRPFTLYKFRTMRHALGKPNAAWTKKGDSRITRVGRFLRKFRLDELPQFLNVIKGEMSVIGPRPEAVELVEEFKKNIPFYDYRYLVPPGITGWAQVNYGNTCTVEGALEKLQYDLYWIKNRSIALDLKIVFMSIRVILTGFGSV